MVADPGQAIGEVRPTMRFRVLQSARCFLLSLGRATQETPVAHFMSVALGRVDVRFAGLERPADGVLALAPLA